MEINAYPFRQEGVQMYCGVVRVDELLPQANVDIWRQEEGQEVGYQRAPESARTSRVARYLHTDSKPIMPTSILLSYRGSLPFREGSNGAVTLEIPEGETLWIVDGQHRVFGIKKAIEDMGIERLRDYFLPIVIIENQSIEDEANQFRLINETMKKVRTDLARRILAMRVAGLGRAARQEVRLSGRLWEATAVEVLSILSKDDDSPWQGRIQPPNVRKAASHVIRELSFSTSMKPVLNERPYRTWTAERIARALKTYWSAWQVVLCQRHLGRHRTTWYKKLRVPLAFINWHFMYLRCFEPEALLIQVLKTSDSS